MRISSSSPPIPSWKSIQKRQMTKTSPSSGKLPPSSIKNVLILGLILLVGSGLLDHPLDHHDHRDTLPSDHPNVHPNSVNLFAFTMRDSRHLTQTALHLYKGLHIFDYVNPYQQQQTMDTQQQLFLDGRPIRIPSGNNSNNNQTFAEAFPCQRYDNHCAKGRILQVFLMVLMLNNEEEPPFDYFFYMESDNELCVSLDEIRALAARHQPYFLSAGVGASGWIMSRQFLQDFTASYLEDNSVLGPDLYASDFFANQTKHNNNNKTNNNRHKSWSVTSRYLVSHSVLAPVGAPSLTLQNLDNKPLEKHLPRCLEPHRGRWSTDDAWDYFDYNACPPPAEVYPCDNNDNNNNNNSAVAATRSAHVSNAKMADKSHGTNPRHQRLYTIEQQDEVTLRFLGRGNRNIQVSSSPPQT